MIILDEELQGMGLEAAISCWYRGAVVIIKHLRPRTVIKDEAIPTFLLRAKQPTFVTINHTDFWRRLAAEPSFWLPSRHSVFQQPSNVKELQCRTMKNQNAQP